MREHSPEFSPEYERIQHHRRLRSLRVPVKPSARAPEQQSLALRSIRRIEIIQVADMPRFHYEVWADFDDGDAELLQKDYIKGLKNAMTLSREAWGHCRVELCRWHPRLHKPLLVLQTTD